VFSRLAKTVLTHNLTRLNAGDYRPALRLDAKDVRFRFPGDSSWATELQGKQALERWLQRFVETGLQIFADEVVVQGPPSNMTLCLRGHVNLKSPEGALVYDNRYVIWGRLAWGLLREYEVYEDTQKSKALDDYLATNPNARHMNLDVPRTDTLR
jgi:ketosteroid isomerase-like protein